MPTNIKWQNMNYSKFKRFLRIMLVFLISVIIIIGSFLIVVYTKYSQRKFVEKYNTNIPCNLLNNYSDYSKIYENLLSNSNIHNAITKAKQNCYCIEKSNEIGLLNVQYIKADLYVDTKNNKVYSNNIGSNILDNVEKSSLDINNNLNNISNNVNNLPNTNLNRLKSTNNNSNSIIDTDSNYKNIQKQNNLRIIQENNKSTGNNNSTQINLKHEIVYPCNDWFDKYLRYQTLKSILIVVIPSINVFIIILLTFLTNFERNKTVTDDLISNMLKCFFSQVLNTVVVLIAVHAYVKEVYEYNKDFFIFTGEFTDMSPKWFAIVGTTIAFSMLINIFSPHMYSLTMYIYYNIKRKRDYGCCKKNKRQTKYVTKKDYFSLYVGPNFRLDTRYAQTLNIIFVILTFSSGFPVLYLFLFSFLFITYWVDKFLLFKFYRQPPKYDLYLSYIFNSIIILSLIFHLCFSIWIYGNPDYFKTSDTFLVFLNNVSDYVNNFNVFSYGIGQEITYRTTRKHTLILFVILVILLACIFIKFFFINIIKLLYYSFFNKDYKTKIISDNNMPIHKALGFNILYKQYQIKKIELMSIVKNNYEDVEKLRYLYINSLAEDRLNMCEMLKSFNIPYIDNQPFNEDNFIEHVKKHNIIDQPKIIGDTSFNITFDYNYESCAFNLLFKKAKLKMMSFNKIICISNYKKNSIFNNNIENKDDNNIINSEIESLKKTNNINNNYYNNNDQKTNCNDLETINVKVDSKSIHKISN